MKRYLIILFVLLSTHANAARYLCTVNIEHGYSSFFAETNQAYKQDKDVWYFKEIVSQTTGFSYIISKKDGVGIINVIDIKNKKVEKEGRLNCKPTGK